MRCRLCRVSLEGQALQRSVVKAQLVAEVSRLERPAQQFQAALWLVDLILD
ncbi:MAG TPA: hypothetical protein VGA01_12040 [Candidatus Binatia bacterium]